MSFLAPLFLAGAAAVALPFIFHLIRRSSRERTLFSSLMFLAPSPPRITKRSRLEHILLLLLRCAVVCLLTLAFARPFIAKPAAKAAALAERNRVLVLLDTSASMRREDLWQQGKERAISAIRALDEDDQAAVYAFDKQPKAILSFSEGREMKPAERSSAVETRLNGIEPSWAGTHFGNALLGGVEHLLEELNRDSQDQGNSHSRLVLISDLQSGGKLDGLQGFEWPKKVQVEIVALKAKEPSNASLQILQETQRLFSSGSNAAVRVRVQNVAASKMDQFQLQWREGSTVVGTASPAYVPAGQSKIIPAPPRPAGADSLILTGDKVDFDNVAWYVAPTGQQAVVTYLGNEAPDNPNESLYYVRRAFEQTNMAVRVVAASNSIPAEAADSALLITGKGITDEGVALARKALAAGKTVIVPLHDANEAATLGTIVSQPNLTATEAVVPNYAILSQIEFSHPLFAAFNDPRFSDFTKIHFWKYRKINFSSITNAHLLAKFDSGDPALVEVPVEKGRVLVLATGWTPKDSQFALSSKFVPLLFAALEQSANIPSAAHQYLVGDTVPLGAAKPASREAKEIVLPDGKKKVVESDVFSEATTPGIYSFGDFKFAVTMEPGESKIGPMGLDELQSLGVPLGKTTEANTARVIDRQKHLLATDLENRQKLWRNFIIAAIAFVMIESWVAGRLSRNMPAGA